MRLRVLSRASDLAVLQAGLVADALTRSSPGLSVERLTRSSGGDRDRRVDLWAAEEKGLFTADLSEAVARGDADIAVHSWKDLPIENYPGNTIAGPLERADPRDVLLVGREVRDRRPSALRILSSSPRRAWQLRSSARRLLPWPVETMSILPVRGNVPTRLDKLIGGEADGLVVAKAALDRLLSDDAPWPVAQRVRKAIDACRWMVLPLKEFPTAPAQGALALEVSETRGDVLRLVRDGVAHDPTSRAVERERGLLESFGGGCSLAVGVTVLPRPYGDITSLRAHVAGEPDMIQWSLASARPAPPPTTRHHIWPRPDERDRARRHPLDVRPPAASSDLWVARAEALPSTWTPGDASIIWTAGTRTWERLAARGVWVNGCAEGLGDAEAPNVDALAGRSVSWQRLTHSGTGDPDALATYVVEQDVPEDLADRTHFYWTSGSLFVEAIRRFPAIGKGWHASGPGRTSRVIAETLGPVAHATIWLEYEQWLQSVTS